MKIDNAKMKFELHDWRSYTWGYKDIGRVVGRNS